MAQFSKLAILCIIVAMFGCDKLSPFISQEEYDERIDLDGDGVPNSNDCDPDDPHITAFVLYTDIDEDGYGSKETKQGCGKTIGLVDKSGDCNDNEVKIHPNASEVCDNIDNDCNGNTDEGVIPRWYKDKDEDLYGNVNDFRDECIQPVGYITDSSDCDDENDKIYPSAIEICDQFDNDCNGATDEDLAVRWYSDSDEDKHGDTNIYEDNCKQPDGYVLINDDCNDKDNTINPEAIEICDDNIDQNCNGVIDDAEKAKLWFADEDGDGFGNPDDSLYACSKPDRYILTNNDCDDTNAKVNPDILETCQDKIDNDCDGITDTDALYVTWYRDVDNDGFGNTSDSTTSCEQTVDGYAKNPDDCDDESNMINPSIEEVCNNGMDDNCDEDVNACTLSGTISLTDVLTKFLGEKKGDQAGRIIASDCDINNDGSDDLLIGAYQESSVALNAGAAYLFYGPIEAGTVSLADADVKFTGEKENDQAGFALTCASDTNLDGFDDVVIGVHHDSTIAPKAGAAYLFYGPIEAGTVSLADADVKFTGEKENDEAGVSMISGCDINNDDSDDLLIGAYQESSVAPNAGATYLFYGPIEAGTVSLADADVKFTGEKENDRSGFALSCTDDQILIGAYQESSVALNAGATYLFYGPIEAGTVSLADADVKFTGEKENDQAGINMISGCDINHDTYDDVLVGANQESSVAPNAGATYLFYGPIETGTISLADADAKFVGEDTADMAGISTTCITDPNGYENILIGAPQNIPGESKNGKVYLISGLGF